MNSVWSLLLGLLLWTAIVRCEDSGSVIPQSMKYAIRVTPSNSRHLLVQDEDLTLKCTTNYVQNLTLRWENAQSNKPVDQIKGITLSQSLEDGLKTSVATLKIKKYRPDMHGSYTCILRNTSTTVVNEYVVELHTLTRENEDVMFYRENNTIKLTCKIDADKATISEPEWRKGDTLLPDVVTDGSTFEEDAENLTIRDVMRSDAAMYTAKYKVSFEEDTFYYDCKVALKADPLVLDFDKSKNLIQEDNLELQCKTLGYPYPVVKWYKDNDLVDGGLERVTMEDLKGVKNGTLKIKSVDYDDAGKYKCVAVTEELKSNSSKTITVRVKDKFAALWPFLGIVAEVLVLCTIIFIYEKHRSRQAEREEANQDEPDGAATDRSEGLRHRNTTSNNPRA